MKHPHAYTDDEQRFLEGLRRVATPLSSEDFERLHDLLGRFPTYEIIEGKFNYEKPIIINQRFMEDGLSRAGVEHVMFNGRPFTPERSA